jgi:RNA polymerase sigma-70 factor (family 1)
VPTAPIHNEKALLQQVAAGDHDAFKQMFHLYADRVHAAVYNYTKSKFIAEELTQDVFIKLWSHRHLLTNVEEPLAYLYRMVFNHINNYLRKTANEARLIERAGLWRTTHDNATARQVEASELSRIIASAVERLPAQKKIIYRLSHEQGLSYQEIAGQLNLSPNTVKNHLVEAMKLLRGYLKDHALELSILIIQAIRP